MDALKNRTRLACRVLSAFIAFTFSFTSVVPPAYAQSIASLNLPAPGAMVTPSVAFAPVLLKGMTIHPDNPLQFDFIIDSGNTNFTQDQIKDESERLVKYFLASMTIPKDDLWVNLSPYEKDRIIPDELGKTELGRDMLAQDYILKQLTASLIYPEKELGKEFWDKVYKQAKEKFGTTEIPVDTFNKVWILPETATVYEHGSTVYIVEAKLKVMLDSDYLAMGHNVTKSQSHTTNTGDVVTGDRVTTEIVKEIILPAIEKEVNEGQNFAPLRQIYHSLILAKWYKETIKNSLLSKVYVDKKLINGIRLEDGQWKGEDGSIIDSQSSIVDQIYNQYMEAYKKGVFNYIKEDYDRLSNETIPRKYFSGGIKGDVKIKKSNSPIKESANKKYQTTVGIKAQGKAGIASKITSAALAAMLAVTTCVGTGCGPNNPPATQQPPSSQQPSRQEVIDVSNWSIGQLIIALDNSKWEIQKTAAQELFRRNNVEGIALAREKLVWPRIRELHYALLGPWPNDYSEIIELGEIAVEPLKENLQDMEANTDTRKWSANLLGQIGRFDDVLPVLASVFNPPPGIYYAWWHVTEAIEGIKDLIQRQPDPFEKSLELFMTHPEAGVRAAVAEVLSDLKDTRAVEPLLAALSDLSPDVREAAADALGVIGDTRAVEPLIILLNDPKFYIRFSATRALGRIGDARAVDPLIKTLQSDLQDRVREGAAEALGQIKDFRVVEPLQNALLQDSFSWVRQKAAEALGGIGDARAVDSLIIALLNDPDVESFLSVRETAATALGKIGDARAVDPLLEAIYVNSNYFIIKAAIDSLGKIRNPKTIGPLHEILYYNFPKVSVEDKTHLKAHTILAIGNIGGIEAISIMLEIANSTFEKLVRTTAIDALGEIGDGSTIPALENLANNDPNVYVRGSAYFAIDKINNRINGSSQLGASSPVTMKSVALGVLAPFVLSMALQKPVLAEEKVIFEMPASKMGQTLFETIEQRELNFLKILLNSDINVNVRDAYGQTALMLASFKGSTEIVKMLLDKGADVNIASNEGRTALMLASKYGHVDVLELLLQKDANINVGTTEGWTALILASQEGHADIVKILLTKGAKIDTKTRIGWTALMAASQEGHADIVRLLLDKGVNVDIKNERGVTALAGAVIMGHFEVVKLLLDKKANINIRDFNGNTALMKAASRGDTKITQLLLDKGADTTIVNTDRVTALGIGASKGHFDVVKLFLGRNVDIATKDILGNSVFLNAVYRGHENIVKILLDYGADVNEENDIGQTALMMAAGEGYANIANLLIDKGANIHVKNERKDTALMMTAYKGSTDIAKLLIDKGVDISAKNFLGETALIEAAYWGSTEIVKLLLEKKADINVQNKFGHTALIRAVSESHIEIIKLLIDKNANVNIQDEDNKTALDFAKQKGQRDIIKILLKAGAKEGQSSSPAGEEAGSKKKIEAGRGKTEEGSIAANDVGGIDMNEIDLDREGAGVDIQFDPAELQGLIDTGIDGFAPVIINITPLPSVLPLLGLDPVVREEEMDISFSADNPDEYGEIIEENFAISYESG